MSHDASRHADDVPDTAEDALLRLAMTIGRRFRQRQADDEVDPAQVSLLYALKLHGPVRLSDLADTLYLDASTVSRHVQQLLDRGLIERDPDPDDGRARIIDLSDDGREVLRASFGRRRALMASALSSWDDAERDDLRRVLHRLTEDLRAQPDA